MEEFASTLVVTMMRQALNSQGIIVAGPDARGQRTVSVTGKRAFLDAALEAGGPLTLLRVAEAVPGFASHPVARLFAGAHSGGEVIERWLRLERYFHSRNRTRLLAADPGHVAMEHFDSRGGEPTQSEDLAVAGIILGLMRWAGGQDVRLRFEGRDGVVASGWLACSGKRYYKPPSDTWRSSRWLLDWAGFRANAPADTAAPSLPRLTSDGGSIDDPLVADLFAAIAADPGASLSLDEQARSRGLSRRTLQRRLQHSGWSLRRITASARIEVAARLLAETDMPIALVGLLAGYSDQPHFQREFARGLGPTPGTYRQMSDGTLARRTAR